MGEFRARFGKANWMGVDHVPSGFSWGFTVETEPNGNIHLIGPAIFASGSTFPDDRLTQAACDFARAAAEEARVVAKSRSAVAWVKKSPAGPSGSARNRFDTEPMMSNLLLESHGALCPAQVRR